MARKIRSKSAAYHDQPSAAGLKFLHWMPRVRNRNFKSKAAVERVLVNPERSQTWRCPRYPWKRTSGLAFGPSALCQYRSLPCRRCRCYGAVYPNAVLRPIFEALHDALDRPQNHSGLKANGDIDLASRVIVVTLPLASILTTNDLANVGTNCK